MTKNLFLSSSYHFDFDDSLIAQYPVQPRDSSRLMIVNRESGTIEEVIFHEIYDLLEKGDQLIFNDTKVIPARLIGTRNGGGQAEIFLLKPQPDDTWKALVKPGKKLREGVIVRFGDDFYCEIVGTYEDGARKIKFFSEDRSFEEMLEFYGQIPLPHYIKRPSDKEFDQERYQTVYAANPGAVAAPTAGLHFTTPLLEKLSSKGVHRELITLHVGLGTFKPVQVEDLRDHKMHSERCIITPEASERLNQKQSIKRKICVGTTSCRVVESAVNSEGLIAPGMFDTDIFIYPGYQFRFAQGLLTNFHLPGSTLMMLVSAFAGYDLIMEAYKKAVREKYRFYSYGDAMLII